MVQCSQCDKPAFVGGPCVDHFYTYQKAVYLQWSMASSDLNYINSQLEASTGGLLPYQRMQIPLPPSDSDDFTFNNIKVEKSTIGAINTGFISNLDTSITVMQSTGQEELAATIQELTQAIIDSKDVNDSIKNEINELLQFLVAQTTVQPENRLVGVAKNMLARIRELIIISPALLTIWDKVEPLIKLALGTS